MRVLLFGTCYCDTREKSRVLEMWQELALRSECDAFIVDSQSPMLPHIQLPIGYYTFKDNIGHLSRNGKDGWGRAFSYGLFRAVAMEYDYVVHVEGDSLFTGSVQDLLAWMQSYNFKVTSTPMSSTPKPWIKHQWLETGFMAFSVDWLKRTQFIQRYHWEVRTNKPVPEVVVRNLIPHTDYRDMPLKTMRDDFKELTTENLDRYKLDWLTHAPIDVMEKFYASS
jgi:hypothetical protein